ncbi:MAG TPA: hypothetical protein VKV22_02655 [Rhodanobacteraceae bacterium]|nr:hypothetical protein [Rhodanobacteraceae bacterium]
MSLLHHTCTSRPPRLRSHAHNTPWTQQILQAFSGAIGDRLEPYFCFVEYVSGVLHDVLGDIVDEPLNAFARKAFVLAWI